MTTQLAAIQKTTLDILSRYLHPGQRVALLDFPTHQNAGDSLIFLGTLEYLRRLGVEIDYIADDRRYSQSELRRRVPHGPILIQGGGNFGDRWEPMQAFRERVVSDFPDRQIIQLPQGIDFRPGPRLEKAQRALSTHPALTLLIRDSHSESKARDFFPNAAVDFCPDLAFGVGPLERSHPPKVDIVYLRRRDSETTGVEVAIDDAYSKLDVDWRLRGRRALYWRILRVPGAITKRIPTLTRVLYPLQRQAYLRMARLNVRSAIAVISQGRITITDRLHATVISGLLEIPVIALDNANGKVRAIVQEYAGSLPAISVADSAEAARRQLLAQLPELKRTEDQLYAGTRSRKVLLKTLRARLWKSVAVLPLPLRRRVWYAWTHRSFGNFRRPRTFSEKVNWRIIHDRSPNLSWTCDKLSMKEHASELAPGLAVPDTLWVGTDVSELANIDLPERWVLKANHRSQNVYLGTGAPDVEELRLVTSGWLGEWQGKLLGEWAYTQARPTMFVESWIGNDEVAPPDYKFFVFDGRPVLVQVDTARFTGHTRRFYTPDWEPLEARNNYPLAPLQERPSTLDAMLRFASAVASQFDFMRVDLYDVAGEIFLGEVTPYPAGGLKRYHPNSLDVELGAHWKLPLQTRP